MPTRSRIVPLDQVFWAIVNPSLEDNRCWEWPRSRERGKYGRFHLTIDGIHHRKTHRIAWALSYGTIPAGLYVCHHCDFPPCCRPSHLFLGTAQENNADMQRKNRMPYGQRAHDRKGRWSRHFDACITCHRTERPHGGHGRCRACYQLVVYRPHTQERKARTAANSRARTIKNREHLNAQTRRRRRENPEKFHVYDRTKAAKRKEITTP